MSAPKNERIKKPLRYTCEVLHCKRVILLLTLFVDYLFRVDGLTSLESVRVQELNQLVSFLLADKDLLVVESYILLLFFLLLDELLGESSLLL
jgi:hypothetical protein